MAQEHLDTAQLLAIHKEGSSGDRAALEHLASCSECQQSFDDSRWLLVLRRLRGIVETGPHPSSDELVAYRGHALSSRRTAQIERHLRSCDRCLAAYRRDRVVDQKLAYSSPAPSLLKLVQRRFRPRPLRQLGTVLVRRLGEQLEMLFVPGLDERIAHRVSTGSLGQMDHGAGTPITRARRTEHPASASERKRRLRPRADDTFGDAVPEAIEETDLRRVESRESDRGIDLPPAVRIPADDWDLVLELASEKGHLFLKLISSRKDASVDGIRVRVSKKGTDPSEAATDRDGRILLPLESGRSKITIHADPPFALDLEFPAES